MGIICQPMRSIDGQTLFVGFVERSIRRHPDASMHNPLTTDEHRPRNWAHLALRITLTNKLLVSSCEAVTACQQLATNKVLKWRIHSNCHGLCQQSLQQLCHTSKPQHKPCSRPGPWQSFIQIRTPPCCCSCRCPQPKTNARSVLHPVDPELQSWNQLHWSACKAPAAMHLCPWTMYTTSTSTNACTLQPMHALHRIRNEVL